MLSLGLLPSFTLLTVKQINYVPTNFSNFYFFFFCQRDTLNLKSLLWFSPLTSKQKETNKNKWCNHQPADAQPVPEQQHPWQTSPPGFIAEHNNVWYGTSLRSVGVGCPGWVPSRFLALLQPPRWRGSVKAQKKAVTPSKRCSAITKTWVR